MEAASFIDAFNLCWSAILKESKQFNGAFFNKEHCKIIDSRDTNFDVVESRLAYTYLYGCYNVLFLEKCISNFFNEYSGAETIFPLENLKVCSLSNGPGLDIVGLLCALCKSNKPLKCFPQLKAVNLYESWLNLYKTIVRTAYEVTSLKSYFEYFHIPSDNIHLIQDDVFSTLSTEARKCISDSNVLLMVKVFVSSKATPTIFANTLKEIFSLLQPGSLIFFIGSKNNSQNFSKHNHLSQYVKCIFGPQKVTLQDIPIHENVVKSVDVKPHDSGHADFIVWQKRGALAIQEMVKSKRKRIRKKNKTSKNMKDEKEPLDDDNTVGSECKDDTDAGSEISFTSGSKQSDTLSDQLKSDSNSSVSNLVSPDEIKAENFEKEQNLSQNCIVHSIDNITSILDKFNIKDLNNEEQKLKHLQQNTFQSDGDSASNLVSNTREIKFKTSTLADKTESKFQSNAHHLKETKNEEISEISLNVKPQTMKENASENKVNLNFASAEVSPINKILQTNLFRLTQNMKHKEISETTRNKKSEKNEMQPENKTKHHPSELKPVKENEKQPKTTLLQNFSSKKQSHENVLKFERSVRATHEANIQHPSDRNKQDFHSLLQRCENLITSLEKMTVDMKNDISSSRNDQHFAKKCCCARQVCGNFRVSHPCSSSVDVVYSCCCRRVCNCKTMIQNNCMSCSNSCRSKDVHEFKFDAGRSTNLLKPCITIPLRNEDLVQILTSRKS